MPSRPLPIVPAVPAPSVAPVLIADTVKVSPTSTSLSFVNTSLIELLVAVKVELVEISIVLLSFVATGSSLIPVTTNANSAVSVPPLPSETVYVKYSLPVSPAPKISLGV